MPNGCPPGSQLYTVRAGDNFHQLAITFRSSVAAITRANPGVNPNTLQVGQQICIPRGSAGILACPNNWVRYAIRSGDTLFQIARQRGTTVDDLSANNPGIEATSLRVGQVICVPAVAEPVPLPLPCPEGFQHYTIRTGDTLFAIAVRRNTDVNAIRRANPSIDPNSLRVGQIICIP